MTNFNAFVAARADKATLAGTETTYILDGGVSKEATTQSIADLASGVGSSSANELLFNNAGSVDGLSGVSWDDATGRLDFGVGDGRGILFQRSDGLANARFTVSSASQRLSLVNTAGTQVFGFDMWGGGAGFFYALKAVHAESGTAIPAGGTAGRGFRLSSTSNFGIFFGSGAPTLSAAQGSLYLRSDGSGTSDRAYINTDGSTTWTAISTVA